MKPRLSLYIGGSYNICRYSGGQPVFWDVCDVCNQRCLTPTPASMSHGGYAIVDVDEDVRLPH